MLPHTALRTARPSWQPAAPVPVSEPGRRAVGRQRGPGRPCGRLRGGADRRARRQYAVPVGPSRVRRVRAARRGGRGRRGRADASAATGRVRGAHAGRIRAGRGRGSITSGARRLHVGAGGFAGASRRWGRGRVRSAGAGASRRWGRGRGRVSSRASHAPGAVRNRTASRAVHRRSRAFPRRSPGARRTGRCGAHVPLACARAATPGGEWPPSWCLGVMRPRRGAWGLIALGGAALGATCPWRLP